MKRNVGFYPAYPVFFTLMLVVSCITVADVKDGPKESKIISDLNKTLKRTSQGILQISKIDIKSKNYIGSNFITYHLIVDYKFNKQKYQEVEASFKQKSSQLPTDIAQTKQKSEKSGKMTVYYKLADKGIWALNWAKEGYHY